MYHLIPFWILQCGPFLHLDVTDWCYNLITFRWMWGPFVLHDLADHSYHLRTFGILKVWTRSLSWLDRPMLPFHNIWMEVLTFSPTQFQRPSDNIWDFKVWTFFLLHDFTDWCYVLITFIWKCGRCLLASRGLTCLPGMHLMNTWAKHFHIVCWS